VSGRIALWSKGGNQFFAGDDAGSLWAIDPASFAGTNKLWSYSLPGDSIKSSPYYHYATNTLQFGTETGKVVVLDAAGAPMTGYPFTVASSTDAIRAGILYWSGILVVGTQNGQLTFIDRNNGTTGPKILVEYQFGSNQVVSGIGYDANTNRYMVSVADPTLLDGRVYYFDAIPDPTPGAL
jgi:outer membrane protein assembly factor BamB